MKVVLRAHKQAIEALKKEGFEVTPLRRGKGDHLILSVKRDGTTIKLSISGSPSCEFIRPLVTTAHRLLEQMASQHR